MSDTQALSGPLARRERLLAEIRELGLRAALISDPRHVHYLSGHRPGGKSPAFLLLRRDEKPLLVVGESEHARVSDVGVSAYEDYSIHHLLDRRAEAARALIEAAQRCGLAREDAVGVEAHNLPAFAQPALGQREGLDVTAILHSMRAVKDAQEQEAIRCSVAVARAGHAAARQAAVAGAVEFDVYAQIQRACVLAAGEPIAFDGDFVSGERSWQIGGSPSHRIMRGGELFICDLFPTVAGYWADTTRTIAVGSPTRQQLEIFDLVHAALERGRQALRPGVLASEVYYEVRTFIADAGRAAQFPHHGGHGIGLEPHESPWIIPGDDTRLRAGMTITLEPGVYVEGVGGVRLEDNYIVTEDGAEVIEPHSLSLQVG